MILSYFPLAFTSDKAPSELGYNGRNYPGWLRMSTKAPYFTAVYAQELRECEPKARVAAIAAGIALIPLAIFYPLAIPLALPIGILISSIMNKGAAKERETELMGHAVETAAAVLLYGVDEEHYLLSEARAMHGHYAGFIGWSEAQIYEGMVDRLPEARKWVAKRMDHLLDVKERVS